MEHNLTFHDNHSFCLPSICLKFVFARIFLSHFVNFKLMETSLFGNSYTLRGFYLEKNKYDCEQDLVLFQSFLSLRVLLSTAVTRLLQQCFLNASLDFYTMNLPHLHLCTRFLHILRCLVYTPTLLLLR